MTNDEIKKLAAEIVEQRGIFSVDPKRHFKQHERMDRLLDLYDATSNMVLKAIIGAVFIGLFALAAFGMGWLK